MKVFPRHCQNSAEVNRRWKLARPTKGFSGVRMAHLWNDRYREKKIGNTTNTATTAREGRRHMMPVVKPPLRSGERRMSRSLME